MATLATQSRPLDDDAFVAPAPAPERRVAIICSKGSLDMAYPGLVLANAARMSGIEVMMFFTFWGLDIVTEKKVDRLHVATVGNPSMHMPTMVGGLPGIETMATNIMKRDLQKLDIPGVRAMLMMLQDAGAHLFACRMAMDMFHVGQNDLVPQVEGVLSAMDFFDHSAGAQIIFI